MSQIKIYGIREQLEPIKCRLSDVIHACVVEALQYPVNKRAHRFFHLDKSDFYYPEGRSDKYTIIEISMFEGRSVEAKKHLYRLLFAKINDELGITPTDIEITIFETPRHDWAMRGKAGDELDLDYKVKV
jgi:phenylpyruvate tautomerase PptA (4-oxalocrotonate tautomerase family)